MTKNLKLLRLLMLLVPLGIIALFAMVLRPKNSPANQAKFVKVSESSYKTYFPSTGMSASLGLESDRLKIEVSQNNSTLQLVTPLQKASLKTAEGEEIVYKDEEAEYHYKTIPNGLKEEIILNKPPQSNQFELKMDLKDLIMGRNADGQPIFFDQNNKYLFHFQKPFAKDSAGAKIDALNYNIKKTKQENSYLLTLLVDQSWLNDSKRQYPVLIDPTVIHDPLNSKPEIEVRRTATSKTFQNSNGSLTAHFWSRPVHYKDDKGKWQDIDTTIVTSTDPNYDFMNITNNTQVWFNQDAFGEKDNLKLSKDGATITMQTIASLTVKNSDKEGKEKIDDQKTKEDLKPRDKAEGDEKMAVKLATDDGKENKIKYSKIYENGSKQLDVIYTVLDYKLQEQVILNQFQGFPEITQEVRLTNAYAKQEDKEIRIYHQDTNELLWVLPQPRMYEQASEEKTNFDLHYELKCKDSKAIEQCSDLILTKVFDQEGKNWLADLARQYPVIIDPDFAGSTADGYIGGGNNDYTTARSTSTECSTYGTTTQIGQVLWQSVYYVLRSYLSFLTSTIPDDATVTASTLYICADADNSDADFLVKVYRYAWVETLCDSSKREANYDGAYGAGATLEDSLRDTAAGWASGTYYNMSVATAGINKAGDTKYVLVSHMDVANSMPAGLERVYIRTTDYASTTYDPYLAVTYTLANGSACTESSECTSNNCVDGYCCNTTCSGNCDRCNVVGSLGTCTNVDADCTGNCDTCSAGNCAADQNLCSACYDCSGSGTAYNCASVGNAEDDTTGTACDDDCTYCTGGVCTDVPQGYECDTYITAPNECLTSQYMCNATGASGNCADPDSDSNVCGYGTYASATYLTNGTAGTSKCCGDDTGEDFEQTEAATRSCCYNASVLSDSSSSGAILCEDGQLYDCNSQVTIDGGVDTEMVTGNQVGTTCCGADNTWSVANCIGSLKLEGVKMEGVKINFLFKFLNIFSPLVKNIFKTAYGNY